MPSWKKVIVSGSQTHLSGITSSVLTQNNLLIANAGGAIGNSGVTLSGNTLALGSNSITSTGANSVLTGSFSGTFSGSLSVNLQDLTQGAGITAFTYDGNSPTTVAVSGASALSTDRVTKWTGAAFADTTITDNGSIITTTTPLSVGGPITASSNISSSAGLIGATLITSGNGTIGGTLDVTGVTTLTGRLQANGAITTTNLTASGNISSSAGLIGNTLTIANDAAVGKDLNVTTNATIGGTLNANGGTIATTAPTANLLNTNATTINFGGGATTALNIGATSGTTTVRNSLAVNGNTTLGDAGGDSVTVNAQTLSLANQLQAVALSSTMLVITSSNRVATQTLGTGIATALGINVGSAGAPVLFNGAGGTPTSITLTNGTGLPISTGVSGLGTNVATFLATPSSANLAAAVTDKTGTGTLVFSASPTFTGTVGAAAITTTGNVVVGGDLTVNGTTTVINTDTLSIEDKFIVLGRSSGSQAPAAEGGIIVEGAGGSGSAFVFNSGSGAGVSNRWGLALSVATGSADVTPTDFMVSAIQASGAPSSAPTYGGSNGGFGNIYVNSSDESIWIFS